MGGHRRKATAVLVAASLFTSVARADDTGPSTSTPAPDRAPEAASQEARSRLGRLHYVSIDGGFAYQSLYGVPITAGSLDLAIGRPLPGAGGGVSIAALVDGTYGSTQDGLHTFAVNSGPLFEGDLGRLRVGGGFRLGFFEVNRVTSGGSLSSMSAGIYARAAFDVVDDAGGAAIFLVVRVSLDTVGAALYGATGGLGVRF